MGEKLKEARRFLEKSRVYTTPISISYLKDAVELILDHLEEAEG